MKPISSRISLPTEFVHTWNFETAGECSWRAPSRFCTPLVSPSRTRMSVKLASRRPRLCRSLVRVQYRPPLHDEVRNSPKSRALENRDRTDDGRHFSPSAARNRGPIREVLEKILPKSGIALEIGSGTGEHVICFAKALPGLLWQPSDPDPTSRASIAAWIAAEGLANVRAPVAIDTRQAIWGVEDEAP